MEEMIHNVLGLLGFILWPISAMVLIYALGAWVIQGKWMFFLIALITFVLLNGLIWVVSAIAEG